MGITRLSISRWPHTNRILSLSLCSQKNNLLHSHFSSSTSHSFVKTADLLSFISGPPEAIDHSQKISLKEERDIIDSIIRINLAESVAAKKMQERQIRPELTRDPMYQEGSSRNQTIDNTASTSATDLPHQREKVFKELLSEYGARPTLLNPLWKTAGVALGVVSSLIDPQTADRLSMIIRDEVAENYNSQLRTLIHPGLIQKHPELIQAIRSQRDAQEHAIPSEKLKPPLPLEKSLEFLVRGGFRAAFWLTKRL